MSESGYCGEQIVWIWPKADKDFVTDVVNKHGVSEKSIWL